MSQASSILLDLQYLPPLQYWTKLSTYPTVHIEQHEHFIKSSYRNRCHIAGVNGPLRLSIPLKKGKNEQQPITQVRISAQDHWSSRHWHSIRSAYANAPFWDYYADQLYPLFKNPPPLLFDFNYQLLEKIKGFLQLSAELLLTDAYEATPPDSLLDFRGAIHPKPHRALPDPHFQSTPYPQVFEEKNGFLPNLSILDLLFCTGPESGLLLKKMVI